MSDTKPIVRPAKKAKKESKPSVAEKILKLCANGKKSSAELETALGVSKEALLKSINALLNKGKLEVFQPKKAGGIATFRCVNESSKTASLHGMGTEERLVYQLIEESGNKGIWTRDLRFKSRLDQKELNRVLKGMESRKIIKSVKTVVAAKKKIWMLYDVTPSRSITGGAWYSDQDFEGEFIAVLCKICTKFLADKWEESAKKYSSDPILRLQNSYATVAEITAYITQTNISKVELEEPDIVNILDTLVFDNAIENRFFAERGEQVYKISRAPKPGDTITTFPCGACPVFHNCGPDGEVTPASCAYMKDWLRF